MPNAQTTAVSTKSKPPKETTYTVIRGKQFVKVPESALTAEEKRAMYNVVFDPCSLS